MAFHIVVALLTLWAATPAFAQSDTGRITGRIVEARTGVPLAAVLVQVQSTRQRALSDPDGAFEIANVPAGPQTLVVSVVGFGLVRRDVLVTAGEATSLTIPVAEGASTYVEEVTVSASPFREAEPAAPSQAVLGSRELLALRGVVADDPFRAAQVLPGVATGDDFRGEFAVRGLGPEHIGISVDGVDSPLLFHTVRAVEETGSLALINSDILDQAVLLAGPHPQRLSAHLGSRLDFSTRDGSRAGFASRMLISGAAATGLFEGPLGSQKRGSWLMAARRSYIDWLLQRFDTELEGTFGFTDVQGGAAYDLGPRQQLRVSFIGGRSVLHDRDEVRTVNSLERGSSRTAIGNARWRFTISPTILLNQQIYIVHSTYENKVTDGRVREEGWDRDVTWRGSLAWQPATTHALEIGAQAQSLRSRRLDRRFTSATASVTTVDARGGVGDTAAYVAYRWMPSSSAIVSPGARIEHWQGLETYASPWLLAEWQLARATRVRGGFAVQSQAPRFDQAILARPGDRLVPERAATVELNLEHRLGDTWRASVGGYHRRDRDRLRLKNSEYRRVDDRVIVPGRAYVDNALSGAARGIELTVERRSVNGWTGWVSYAYSRSTLTDETPAIPLSGSGPDVAPSASGAETFFADYDQRHTLNVYSGYRWSDRTSLSARFRYGSNFPIAGYLAPRDHYHVLIAQRNQTRLPDYSRLDLRADRAFTYRKRRLTLFVEVINALNRENSRAHRGSVNPATGNVFDVTERLLPLLPSAGVLVEF